MIHLNMGLEQISPARIQAKNDKKDAVRSFVFPFRFSSCFRLIKTNSACLLRFPSNKRESVMNCAKVFLFTFSKLLSFTRCRFHLFPYLLEFPFCFKRKLRGFFSQENNFSFFIIFFPRRSCFVDQFAYTYIHVGGSEIQWKRSCLGSRVIFLHGCSSQSTSSSECCR